jgi:hypothetical protein
VVLYLIVLTIILNSFDSKITRDAIHLRTIGVTEFESIIGACRELLSISFTDSRVEFIRRQTNVAAHALAREATLLDSSNIYYAIPFVLKLLLLMKCYKHIFLKKNIFLGVYTLRVQLKLYLKL